MLGNLGGVPPALRGASMAWRAGRMTRFSVEVVLPSLPGLLAPWKAVKEAIHLFPPDGACALGGASCSSNCPHSRKRLPDSSCAMLPCPSILSANNHQLPMMSSSRGRCSRHGHLPAPPPASDSSSSNRRPNRNPAGGSPPSEMRRAKPGQRRPSPSAGLNRAGVELFLNPSACPAP